MSTAVSITITLAHGVTTYGGTDGSIKTSIEGGIPPYFYQWTKDGVNQLLTKSYTNLQVKLFLEKSDFSDLIYIYKKGINCPNLIKIC